MGFDGSLFTGAVVFVKGQFGSLTSNSAGRSPRTRSAATLSIFLAGPLADRIGRRTVLRFATAMFAASAIVAALASSFSMLIVARLLSGLGVGAVLVAAPMYIAEISPAGAARPHGDRSTSCSWCSGIFLAFGQQPADRPAGELPVRLAARPAPVRIELALDAGHRRAAGVRLSIRAAVRAREPALARHARAPRRGAAHAGARTWRGAGGTRTRRGARLAGARDRASATPRLRDLWAPQLRGVLFIGLVVGVLQQITGINSVLAYATMIFASAADRRTGVEGSFVQTLLITLVNVVFTVIALLLIDRVGRRPLLLAGTAGIAGIVAGDGLGFRGRRRCAEPGWVLAGLLGFVACFAIVARAGHVGAAVGDLSEPGAGAGHLLRGPGELLGVFRRAAGVSVADGDTWVVRAHS